MAIATVPSVDRAMAVASGSLPTPSSAAHLAGATVVSRSMTITPGRPPRRLDAHQPVGGLTHHPAGARTHRQALRLAERGARVTAVDCSSGMLARARAKPGAERVRFVEHDLAAPLPFAGEAFDRVACGLVVDHHAPLGPFFAELGRICRPSGLVVVSVMHPAMMLRGVQARFTDPATGHETRPASQAHQISDYVLAAVTAGLSIRNLVERAPDEALAARVPRAARYVGWPLLFVMVLAPAT
jgi:SAM-dependent methyltransferase